MPSKLSFILFFLACSASFQVGAQRAKYTTIPVSYDVRIPEKTGSLLHAWGASAKQMYSQTQTITLTLYIFAPDMRLLAHRNLRLGKVVSWNIDFQYSDSCYYASIYYRSDSLYHILVSVSNDGTVTDVGDRPQLWHKENLRQLNKYYALQRCNNNLYSIKIENAAATDSIQNNTFISLEKEPGGQAQNPQKIIIKKVNLQTKEESQRVYVSALNSFLYPFIHATDSCIFAYSFTEPVPGGNGRHNTGNGSKLFSVRLDTNLNPTTSGAEMIKVNGPIKHKAFSPHYVFLLDKKAFIVDRGWDPDGMNYSPLSYNRNFGFARMAINVDQTNSFRITVLDSSNRFFRDTIIEDRSGDAPLKWDNRFITVSDKKIDFFFTRQFRASKNGMTRMYVDSEGKLGEDNIIVDERYEYYLPAAVKLPGGRLLVPYGKYGRTMGIMNVLYDVDGQ